MKEPLITYEESKVIEHALNLMCSNNGIKPEDKAKAIKLRDRLTSKIEHIPKCIEIFRSGIEQDIRKETEAKVYLFELRTKLQQDDELTDDEYNTELCKIEAKIKLIEKRLVTLRSINNMTYNTCCDYGTIESLRTNSEIDSDYWIKLYEILEDYITLPQASEYLAISADIIRSWERERNCEHGAINMIRYNGYLLINKHDCDKINIKHGRETKEIKGHF